MIGMRICRPLISCDVIRPVVAVNPRLLFLSGSCVSNVTEDFGAEISKGCPSCEVYNDIHVQHQTDTACSWLVCHSSFLGKPAVRPRNMAGEAPTPCGRH